MAAPVAPLVLAASALGFGLWWFWPAQSTGATVPTGGGDGGGGGGGKGPTAEQTATAKAKGAADGCARGTADAVAGKSPAQASVDLNPGGKDNAAWLAAGKATDDPEAYFDAYGIAHATCYNAVPKTKTMPMPLPSKYTVAPGDTPVSIAGKYGVTVDYLLAGLNGYGHGDNGSKDFAPLGHKFAPFTSTVEWSDTPPKGTHYEPTWQAEHKTLFPVFRSSVPGPDGDYYWAVNDKGRPHAHSGPGFGRIYQDGLLYLVGPWYSGMTLNVPAKPGDAEVGAGALVSRSSYAVGPQIGNFALVGARRAPVEVDQLHAGMGGHFSSPRRSSHALGWPAPPDDVDDGVSTLYRSY